MRTLVELLPAMQRLGRREAVRWSNGLRTWIWSYSDLFARAGAFSQWLDSRRVRKGDRIMIWGENRPEWLVAFWGAVAKGVEVVPIDFRFSSELAERIRNEAHPKILVHGSSVDTNAIAIERISFDELTSLPPGLWQPADVFPEDVVEIVYTSGTTGEPKGVVHRHRNVCANLNPFQSEINKYKSWAAPFQPIRLLNLLPLSHMFGQSQGLFIPLLLGGSVVFTEEMRPAAVARLTREHRISVIVAVPRLLESMQHDIQRRFTIPSQPSLRGWMGVAARWWRYRRIHAAFGWKFWAFVVGGARLDPELEEFWASLGYLVIQGYGLTEASPVVAVNHPFAAKRGSLGKVVPGQDVIIAQDGEILVRGESVTGAQGEWLHTGDLGEIDSAGRLYYRGRKKEMIVTPDGLNVHPEDVEAVLNNLPEVRESAVIAQQSGGGGEHVHAALLLRDPHVNADAIISRANQQLESHQRIKGWTVWPEEDFPRTASTLKLKRGEIARRIASGVIAHSETVKSGLDEVLARNPGTRLNEDLGLSSLERVELMSEVEGRYGVELDEETFSQVRTVEELRHLTESNDRPMSAPPTLDRWPVAFPTRIFRFLIQHGLVLPLFRHYIPLTVSGLEHLSSDDSPVIFAANHTSHLDTIVMVAALPERWRRRLAPAMSKDYFRAWFDRRDLRVGFQYALARAVFNTYPLPQEMSGVKRALHYTAELVQAGYCPLVYPEGRRTPDRKLQPFRPGIGMMAVRLQVPVIPVYIAGLFDVYSIHHDWPKAGPVLVTFGRALKFNSSISFESAAEVIENAVRGLEGGHTESEPPSTKPTGI